MKDPHAHAALVAQLTEDVGLVTWRDVAAHHRRGAVFAVAAGADLVAIAAAVIGDDVAAVHSALDRGDLARLEPTLAEAWARDGAPPLRCLIAQPYVLIQTQLADD